MMFHVRRNCPVLSAKYQSLSRQELLEKAAQLGSDFERFSGSCSQCTAAALREDIVVKVATSSCGGQAGLSNGVCGGVIGGTIVLDYYLGRPVELISSTREIPEGLDALSSAMESARSFCKKFTDQYGSILCPQVQTKIYGRSYDLQNPEDWEAFMDAGAHSDPTKCMRVVANSAKWALETLMEKGLF